MSPQFVDFDADGRLDIVAGIFDGSPHVAYGSEKGYAQPVQILDAKGERILLNQFWNFDTKKWEDTQRCDAPGAKPPEGQCTSAVAFDWDADGDLDLLLGDYKTGRIYRRVNEGKAGAPKFATVNLPVMAGDKPLELPSKLATPRLVDWDKDGRVDLVCGSFGTSESKDHGGGVYLLRNAGRAGAPKFAPAQILVASGGTDAEEPVRPDVGLYPDVADVDGDGDFDLIVGGSAEWTPPQRKLTKAEEARAAELKSEIEKVDAALQALYEAIAAESKGLGQEAADKAYEKHDPELSSLNKKRSGLQDEFETLTPGPKSVYSVWLYLNKG